ncbi:hypothetical protein IEO21_11207 [Rhodonia placenta]|uniref:Uncharacterized protein n=1 Tax=Rhodonia placenta TaxID=104341 RepID=A0A8H7NR51_9APHY|nr:hypothetical protein IEO21_11207 [Postia placenta]
MTFQQRFEIATRQKKVWAHFNGTSPCPTSAVPTAPMQAEQAAIDAWQKHRHKGTAAAIWNAISQEFVQKSMLLRANLRTQFLNMRYTPSANLHMELVSRLRVKRLGKTKQRTLGAFDWFLPQRW